MTNSEQNIVETRTTKIWLDENGIMYVKTHAKAQIDLDDMKTIMDAQVTMSGGQTMPILLDMRQIQSTTREAREYAARNASQTSLCVAMLVGSAVSRISGNFFMNFNKPVVPTRLFTSEAEAIEWLKGFLE